MKGSGRIILGIFFASSFFILYVHGQVSILQLSYDLNHQAEILDQKTEAYRFLRYDVDTLKSPKWLETKMKTMSLDLRMPQQIKVVHIPVKTIDQPVPMPMLPRLSLSQRFSGFLGQWVGVAQAKTAGE